MIEHLPTGVPGLDKMLNGGFIAELSILVRGAPGTGKTTLGFQYLAEGARRGEVGLFVAFEEFPQSLYRDAASIGIDLAALEKAGMLTMLFTSPEVLLGALGTPDNLLMRAINEQGVQRVVLDSLTYFTRLTNDDFVLRGLYNQVVNGFRREGVTALFLGEEARTDFTAHERGRLSFLVDCIVLLRYLEIDSAIQHAILVPKMRSSDHDKAIYRYTIGAGGISVGAPLEGRNRAAQRPDAAYPDFHRSNATLKQYAPSPGAGVKPRVLAVPLPQERDCAHTEDYSR